MGRGHLSFEEYLSIIPEEFRCRVNLLEEFRGNRTNISFAFSCGCVVEQCLKAFLKRDSFEYCTKCKPKKQQIRVRQKKNDKFDGLIDGYDYVACAICGFRSKSLGSHVSNAHGISADDYKKDHKIICDVSFNCYKNQNYHNGNWINRAKERGEDLKDYYERMSQAVSSAILSDPDDRKRRAKVMSDVNKSDVMRKKASETAKKTSARREIQLERVGRIHAWQKANPQEFYDKCINKMLNVYNSKPESLLYDIIKDYPNYNLKRHRKIRSDKFKPYKQRDIDIGDADRHLFIEYDGPLHFKQTSLNQLDEVREKDILLNNHITDHNWTLIRIGHDQFSYRKSDYGFKKECLDILFSILDTPTSGVHYIGKVYENNGV